MFPMPYKVFQYRQLSLLLLATSLIHRLSTVEYSALPQLLLQHQKNLS